MMGMLPSRALTMTNEGRHPNGVEVQVPGFEPGQ
jgi:hypothetical protein